MLNQFRDLIVHPLGRRRKLATLWRFLCWQAVARKEPQKKDWIAGTSMMVSRGRSGITGNLYWGLHEPADMAFFVHFLRPGELFLDVGANLGAYSILSGALAGADVLAFEPSPDTYAMLSANLKLNGLEHKLGAVNAAVGSQIGQVHFTVGLDAINHVTEAAGGNTMMVPVVTLDDATPNRPVTAIKIDTEGYELEVLKGAQRVLAGTHPCAVQIEVGSSAQGQAVYAHMLPLGFEQAWYNYATHTLQREELPGHANLLFVRGFEQVQQRLTAAARFDVYGVSI